MFDAVLDLPTTDQAAYIDHACSDDATLRAEVIQLLRAHHRTSSVLDTPAGRLFPLFIDGSDVLASALPSRIGPFRVVRAIGEGGMGQVFLGERDDGQFEQRVALKVIRDPAPGLVRRFLEERRILASLEHPNIARLVDGGITADELPYFAMEFVDGEPIDRYCASHNLTLDERLALFEDVCRAVAYAHEHLIIHRDLKPANILVTADGQVKLLDFGIAKLLDAPGGRATTHETRTGVRVMTPDVAAPEQVLGRSISTATDVYALGVLLYALVAGERPYDLRGKSAAEIERIVCEIVPAPPSARAPSALRRRIRGDLDLIVMTALQKQEERRYRSPSALALDVQRFRQGRAIEARPDSARYRLGKFVVRHRTAVAIGVLIVAAVVTGVVRERVLRQRAEVEARKANEVEGFLVSVFDVADPYAWSESERGAISARELLDRGAKRIDSTLVGQPEVRAELSTVFGRVYTNLGLLEEATPLLERALAQRTALHGQNDTSVATVMDLLGTALGKQDRFDDAERLLRTAVARRRQLLGIRDERTAIAIEHLAELLEDRNQFREAETLHREELSINQALFGDSSVEVANSLTNLGLVLYRQGAYEEAERLYRRSLDILIRRLGERHALTAATMQNLAQTIEVRGKTQEAEQYYRRSLVAKRAVLGDLHPSVTIGLNNFGQFLANALGRLDEAEAMTREAIALDRRIFGDHHTYVAEGLRNLGVILRARGQFVQSDSVLRLAIEIDRPLIGDRHEKTALLYAQLANTRYQLGDLPEAIRLTRQALSSYREKHGDNHPTTLALMGNLARQLTENGYPIEAESLARGALTRLDSTAGSARTQYILITRTLGAALLAERRADEALPLLARAVDMARRTLGEDDYRTAQARMSYGSALIAKRRYEDAAPLLRAAHATLQKHRTDQPRLAAQAALAVAALPDRFAR